LTILAVALVIALLTSCAGEHRSSSESAVRFSEARFSLQSQYQPVANRPQQPSAAGLRRAADWRRAALQEPTAVNLRQLGVAHASVAQLDEAIRILEELSVTGDGGAAAWSDLAAVYMTRAQRRDDVSDYFRALNSAGAALQLEPALVPAWFNLAIVQGILGLRSAAASSWIRFLELETEPGWRSEARVRMAAASAATTQPWVPGQATDPNNASAVRRWLLESAMPAYARGDTTAIAMILEAADRLSSVTNDPAWAVAVDELVRSAAVRSAHVTYADSRRAWQQHDFEGRRVLLLDACRQFGSVKAALTSFCLAEQSEIEALNRDYGAAYASAKTAGQLASERGYLFAAARAIAAQAMVDASVGRFDDAARLFPIAILELRTVYAFPETIGLETTFADLLNLLGRQREGWQRRQAALRVAAKLSEPESDYAVFSSAAVLSFNAGWAHAARHFAAMPHGELAPLRQIAKLQRQLRAETAVGDTDKAQSYLQHVRTLIAASDDPRARTIDVDVDVGAGLLLAAEGQIDGAIQLLNQAVGRMGIVRQRQRTDALVWVSRLETRAGRLADARSHLEQATSQVRARLKSSDAVGSLVDERAWLWAAASDLILADEGSGAERDLALLENIKNAWSAPTTRLALPGGGPRDALMYFVVGERSLGAWCRTNGALTFRRLEVSPAELARMLARLRLQYRSGLEREDIRATLRTLHQLVMEPFQSALKHVDTLHIVPDGLLFGMPFAGLVGPAGRYLVEDVELTFAYTVTDDTAHRVAPEGRVLLVGNPTTAEAEPLPEARREVADIAAVYGSERAVVLTDGAATEEAFRQQVPGVSIVHFAGHAVADAAAPERSRLLLASSGTGPHQDGSLSIAELRSSFDLSHAPVVILAACSTAGPLFDRRFGVGHMASELRRAGAAGVLATVDDIPDRTGPLYVAFHSRLATGMSPAAALRAAQVKLLSESGDSIERWALAVLYDNPYNKAE
jgi:CHAT domain-containing protein